MNRRTLGKTDMEVSEVGLGAWQLGDGWGETVDEAGAIDLLLQSFEAGINFVDTAAAYGNGRSEELIGRALREWPDRIHVATKIKRHGFGDRYEEMESLIREQIKRLGVECIDLIQLHCEDFERVKEGKIVENLERLRANGLVRYTGASVETMEEAAFFIEETGCDAIQLIFNLFRQRPVEELFPEMKTRLVGLIARVPLASGLLTGKFTRDHGFAADDHRSFNADGERFNVGETFAGVPFAAGVELAAEVEKIFRDHGRREPMGVLALRWILDFPEIGTVIPGAKRADQMLENTRASYVTPLSPELHAELKNFYLSRVDSQIRGAY